MAAAKMTQTQLVAKIADAASSTDEDRALKDRHRAMWALGDYPALATNVISSLGPALVALPLAICCE